MTPTKPATDLDCFHATTAHQPPPRVLCHAGFTEDLHNRLVEHTGTEDLAGHYGMMRTTVVGLAPPTDYQPPDYGPYWQDEDLPEGATVSDSGVVHVPSGFYHFTGMISPLRNARKFSEIESYPLADLALWQDDGMGEKVELAHAEGRIAVSWVGHIYETAWQIRGYEQFLMDMIERPEWAQCLLDRLAEQNFHKAVAAARAGVDLIHCGDDIANQNAMMFQPDTWRGMIKPCWQRIWAEARRIKPDLHIWYHSDGNPMEVIGDLIDIGVDVLNPLQPECLDNDEVHRRYGDKLTFDGCMGTQSTMPWGTVEDVRARVKELIDKYGRNGGLIISPTHVLEPEVPLANIDAMFDACREYGTFA